MNIRSGLLAGLVVSVLAALTAAAVQSNPEARQCAPLSEPQAPEGTGRTVISDMPWDPALGGEKVVYGADDRIDVYQESNAARKALAASVCALLTADQLAAAGGGGWHISTSAYRHNGLPACATEPFGNQPTAAFCTGFLVGSDLIATAGHCYDSTDISSVRFVFGFEMIDASTPDVDVSADQVYTGIELVGHQLNASSGLDYSIIRVDRAVTAPGAAPLPLRRSGTIPLATQVGVIGHPSGLPKKIAFGSATRVVSNSETSYFVANLDTYGGNSGSPVFNAATGVVEGILVRGNTDFLTNGGCFVSNVLPDSTADAEEVSKAPTFASFVPELAGEGSLLLNATSHPCNSTLGITLTDANATGTTQQVTVTADSGDTETVTLTETAAGSHTFTGNLPLHDTAVTAQDGTLSVADGNGVTVRYSDQNTGEGQPGEVTATATVDCSPPVISGVAFAAMGGAAETVTFDTSETATATVIYSAAGCDDAGALSVSASAGTSHSATLTGLTPGTTYHVSLTATDTLGNTASDDHGGACYTFATATDPVSDGGFELGTPNPVWDQGSTAYGSVICDAASCGTGNTTGPFSGDWWAWFGGVENAVEDGYAAQQIVIPASASALLTFALEIPSAHVPGYFRVLMDGAQLFRVTEADAGTYAAFKTVTVSVSAYADGAPHVLRFEGRTDGTGAAGVTNFFVDQVGITPSDEGEPPVPVTVPGVAGLAQNAAVATLQTGGLAAQIIGQQCSDVFAAGQVISQTPEAGASVDTGATVSLMISSGACPVQTEGEGEPATVQQIAQALYDGFDGADTDKDGALSMSEAQALQPDLTGAVFLDLDTNDDGRLSQDELAAYLGVDPGCGCACNKSDFTAGGMQKRLGDFFLAGLSLAALAWMAGRREN